MFIDKIKFLQDKVATITTDLQTPVIQQFLDWFARKLELHFVKQTPDMILSKGSLVYVELGMNIRSEIFKTRPCLVISPSIFNMGNTVLICPITGLHNDITKQEKHSNSHQYLVVYPDTENSLTKPSIINLGQMRSISKKRIGQKIGRLSSDHLVKLNKKLKKYLALL